MDGCIALLGQLAVSCRILRRQVAEVARPLGLSDSHYFLMWRCGQSGSSGASQRELVEALAVSPAQVSGLCEQLRARNLLCGHRPADDRRRQIWRLTAEGNLQLDRLATQLAPWAENLFAHGDPRELSAMLTQLVPEVGDLTVDGAAKRESRLERGAA